MNKSIMSRVLMEAIYINETKSTIRETAKEFEISKSTVHKDIQEKLVKINPELYDKIKVIFNEHIATRHIRGGESTRKKYNNK